MLAALSKAPSKLDCLKPASVLALESLEYSHIHLVALLLFIGAIIHTLSVRKIHEIARRLEIRQTPWRIGKRSERGIGVQIIYFLAEVEIVFAIWSIPLFLAIAWCCGFDTALGYINTRDFTEPFFVVIILSLTMTRPVVHSAEKLISFLARGLGGTLSAWWFTLLTVGPIMGSFISEAGTMGICALTLSEKFYSRHPSPKLAYATIALLFVNVSIGGILTNFASPAALILSHAWNWSNWHLMSTYGVKAVLGIIALNSLYWFLFRKEFKDINERVRFSKQPALDGDDREQPIPLWVTLIHYLFIAIVVCFSHYPAIFIAAFLFFLGFHQSTRLHQYSLRLTRPLLVGLFLAGLVILGGLQGWWVVDALSGRSPLQVLGLTLSLTAFNDNAAISYLAILIPDWSEAMKYALLTGAIAGGGLTVIANAPNPAGYVVLSKHFEGGLSPLRLFLAALFPTFAIYLIFLFWGPLI